LESVVKGIPAGTLSMLSAPALPAGQHLIISVYAYHFLNFPKSDIRNHERQRHDDKTEVIQTSSKILKPIKNRIKILLENLPSLMVVASVC
jgi:hypothetical protein